MILFLVGDTHDDFAWMQSKVVNQAKRAQADAVVQLGDFGFIRSCNKDQVNRRLDNLNKRFADIDLPLYWLDGNHENFEMMERVGAEADAPEMVQLRSHITYLPRGLTWEWDGVTFMSLGGAYSIDQDGSVMWIDYFPQEVITYAQGQRAIDAGHVDVMLTHDAPDGIGRLDEMLKRSSDFWADALGARWHFKHKPNSFKHREMLRLIVDEVRPRVLVHGHYHHRYEDVLRGDGYATKVIGLDRNKTGKDAWTVLDTAEFDA